MKPKFTNLGRRRRQRPGLFFLSALVIAIVIFVVAELVQFWVHHGEKTARQETPASVTALMPQPSGDELAGFKLFMHRAGCKSGCPNYALSAKGDILEYVGVRGVKKRGDVKEPLATARKRELLQLVRKASFFALADSYDPANAACKLKQVDAPTFTIGITLNGETKVVRANEGCANVPPRLRALARGIDRVSNSARWTGVVNVPASATAR